jgi:glycosyltransferase involved in cell wall biosynthesis
MPLRRQRSWPGSSAMPNPAVSVIMAVRDGERYVAEALESVFAQTRPPDEVIVVDDGSEDGTTDVVRTFPVRLLSQAGQGVSAARNAGLEEARGDLIAFIDHDDRWLPRKVECQVAYLEERPEVDYALCWFRSFVEPGAARPDWVRDEHLTRGWTTLCTGSLMTRRTTIDLVGYFDTALELCEDSDWIARAHEAGMTRGVQDEVLFEYRVHSGNTTVVNPVTREMLFDLLRRATARRAANAIEGGRPRAG